MSELQSEIQDERIRLKARFKGEALQRRLLQKEYQVLNALIERKLQLQAAQTKGLTVTDDEFRNALKQLPPDDQADAFSDQQKNTQLRDELLLQKLRNFEVRQHVMVPESEVRRYYQDHMDQFVDPPTYRLRQILMLPKPGQTIDEIMARAKSIEQALRTGEDFAELALQYSDGPEASRGGELGWVAHDELLEPLAQALKGMKPGDLSQPIETTLGSHIIALDEIKSAEPRPLDQVETEIKTRLYQQRIEERYQRWLADLKQKAYIEIKF